MKRLFLILLTTIVVGTGCNDNISSDEDKPTITSVNFLNGYTIPAGDSLNVRMTFEDNVALSEAFVEIHDNFEGHKHQKANTKFATSTILNLEGTSDTKTAEYLLPANAAAGPYHFNVSALDADGNRSDTKVFSFLISQPGQPVFKSMVKELTVSTKTDFTIEFEVSDDIDLKEVSYVIEDEQNHSAGSLFDGDIDLDGPDDTSFTFKQTFSVHSTSNELAFIVTALDSDDNMSIGVIEIHVK